MSERLANLMMRHPNDLDEGMACWNIVQNSRHCPYSVSEICNPGSVKISWPAGLGIILWERSRRFKRKTKVIVAIITF